MLVVPERQLPHHHHRYELDYLQEEEESMAGDYAAQRKRLV